MTGPSPAAPRYRLAWAGTTVVGKVRTNNEDTLWAGCVGDADVAAGDSSGQEALEWPGVLLSVADGMGGALAGEVASGLAVSTVKDELARRVTEGSLDAASKAEDRVAGLIAAVEQANQRIRGEGENNPQQRGMGTTLTAVWVHGGVNLIAQVGDSRAYLFRDGHLTQLTKDQSLVGKLIEDGIITEDEAERIAGKNIILQALGSEDELDVAAQAAELEEGDLVLLCTDGLTAVVNNEDLEGVLRRGGSPAELCERLTELAEERGGPDNITVLIGAVSAE